MLNREQSQAIGDGATAVQAGGNVTIFQQKLSCADVRAIALGVYRENFDKLTGAAKATAGARAEEITDEFLKKLKLENPDGFRKAEDPDCQHSLFTVQKEYARTGDKDLGDLLVEILIDRSKQDQRDILQIVLNESLKTAPKLAANHFAVLSVIFALKYMQAPGVANHQQLGEYFDRYILRFVPMMVKSDVRYQHLEFSGCGSIQISQTSLESVLSNAYGGHFSKGFELSEIAARGLVFSADLKLLIACHNDPTKAQVAGTSKAQLEQYLNEVAISPELKQQFLELYEFGKMNDDEIRQTCVSIRPYMAEVFDIWSNSSMKSFTLTSVGIAIAHANIKRHIGEFADLAIWIN